MAGNQKFPSDLLLVAGLVILADIFVLIPVLSGSIHPHSFWSTLGAFPSRIRPYSHAFSGKKRT